MEHAIKEFGKKYANISELTDSPSLESIETLYRQLASLANNSGIPMKLLKNIEKDQPVCPEEATEELHPTVQQRFLATLYYKIDSLIPPSVPKYHDIVMQNIDNEDGYATLYQILRTVLPQLQDFRPKWGPTLH
jgi:hypothetical protein